MKAQLAGILFLFPNIISYKQLHLFLSFEWLNQNSYIGSRIFSELPPVYLIFLNFGAPPHYLGL